MHTVISADEASLRASVVTPAITAMRIAAGFAQGIALYWLYHAAKEQVWPASSPYLFQPLLLVLSILPPLFITGLGYLRASRMLAWMLAAGAVLSLLAWYECWREALPAGTDPWPDFPIGPRMMPLFPVAAAGMFVAHSLVMGGAAQGRIIAHYRCNFEAAWKLAIQSLFAVGFALVFWLLLTLGAELLMLVKVALLRDLTRKGWVLIPALSTACACALHVTDVRPGIVRGIRSLLLALLCWLLPVVVLIVLGFLLCLPWTGLAPLWATRHGTMLLIGVTLVLLLLINAAYQDGRMVSRAPLPIRISVRIAAPCLVPLVALAAHALTLRVQQHGWTSDRIIVASCLMVLGIHAIGYACAALRRHDMEEIARINTACSLLFLALLLGLLSPLADPARLSVASQVARLESDRVEASRFDYDYLRQHGARHGTAALERLTQRQSGADAAIIRQKAQQALQRPLFGPAPATAAGKRADVAANLRVLPQGASLPPSFLSQDWNGSPEARRLPACLTMPGSRCDAFVIDLNADGKPEVLLLATESGSWSAVLSGSADGAWKLALRLPWQASGCVALRDALAAGDYRLLPRAWPDLGVLGLRLPLDDHTDEGREFRCPDAPR